MGLTRMLDVKLLTLLTVAEEKNFTKAAQKLSLTQPAVSHHISMLEEELSETDVLEYKPFEIITIGINS